MEIDKKQLEEYVNILSTRQELVDELSDDVVDQLIVYLEEEIANQEKILDELKDRKSE